MGSVDQARNTFSGMKVFSTTMARDRDRMGETITQWLTANPEVEIVDKVVAQSSDAAFHCFTVILFYRSPTSESQSE